MANSAYRAVRVLRHFNHAGRALAQHRMLCLHKRCGPSVAGIMQSDAVRCRSQFCEANASAIGTAVLEEGDVVSAELVCPDVLFSREVFELKTARGADEPKWLRA